MKDKSAMTPVCNICKKQLKLISEYVLCKDCYKKEKDRVRRLK